MIMVLGKGRRGGDKKGRRKQEMMLDKREVK